MHASLSSRKIIKQFAVCGSKSINTFGRQLRFAKNQFANAVPPFGGKILVLTTRKKIDF